MKPVKNAEDKRTVDQILADIKQTSVTLGLQFRPPSREIKTIRLFQLDIPSSLQASFMIGQSFSGVEIEKRINSITDVIVGLEILKSRLSCLAELVEDFSPGDCIKMDVSSKGYPIPSAQTITVYRITRDGDTKYRDRLLTYERGMEKRVKTAVVKLGKKMEVCEQKRLKYELDLAAMKEKTKKLITARVKTNG